MDAHAPNTNESKPMTQAFFTQNLKDQDADLMAMIEKEFARQQDHIELIASENIVSKAVLEAQGSILTNKYAEGYPGRRYYGGCAIVDEVENLARERAKALFECQFANVQPHSGSQANQAVFLALLTPGDKVLGLDLASGGHLTHGASVNVSGKWFDVVHYGVRPDDHRIDMDEVRRIAQAEKPKLIIAGGSAYSRVIDFAAFRAIADEVGAYLMVDMAHIAGLVASGLHPSPFPHAHVATTTTHKTLRGPRGGMILTNEPELAKKLNSAVFPGLQGGPLMHVIAAKAVAFGEALRPEFKTYSQQVVKNAQALANSLNTAGLPIISGGTDIHLALVDLTPKGVNGQAAEETLERVNITLNKNGIPNDPLPPRVTSGIRVGSPAGTTRGFTESDFTHIGEMIVEIIDMLRQHPEGHTDTEAAVRAKALELTRRYPIYPDL